MSLWRERVGEAAAVLISDAEQITDDIVRFSSENIDAVELMASRMATGDDAQADFVSQASALATSLVFDTWPDPPRAEDVHVSPAFQLEDHRFDWLSFEAVPEG